MILPVYAFFLHIFLSGLQLCFAISSITPAHFLKDPETVVSNNGFFRLGFFSPPNSTNRYVGIWYNHPSIMEVIWVANRNNPLTDSDGVLKLSEDGNLRVSNARDEIFWSSNVRYTVTSFSIAQLLDSGNLIVQGFASNETGENGTILWQSFEHPTDAVLANMSFIVTPNSDSRKVLRAWKSFSDPSDGRYSIGTKYLGVLQVILWDGDQPYWRSGPWNGNIFIGARYQNTGYGKILQEEVGEMLALVFAGANETLMSHYSLSYQGIIAQRWWNDSSKKWEITIRAPENECDIYGKCGEFGSCSPHSSPICSCLKGFEPKNKEEWRRGKWTSGCARRKKLQCGLAGGKQDGFLRLQRMKVPENAELIMGLNLDQCRTVCLTNCSCLAYAYDTQITCLTWSGNLIDVADLSPGGVDLYLRLAQSELNNRKGLKAIVAVSVTLAVVAAAAIIWFLRKKYTSQYRSPPLQVTKFRRTKETPDPFVFGDKSEVMINDLQILDFVKLAEATNSFNVCNLLGTGGFGQVYKGKLESGQEIAVKRLSRASGQGVEEFMNEVELISKLQHRNLVRLLGCCVEGEEKMLIYEYLPNKSLDAFLFGVQKNELSQWDKRFNIIQGICRGLVYLHRDSRLKIIHRDLKASNILLDKDLNPKISDFGMARIFGGNQDQVSTKRIVGTYGYMSPEYAMEGHFSEKSDVFSFGVLLLEIVSGKKNSSFWYQEEFLSLLGYAWKLWNEKSIISLIDLSISSSENQEEILRCIHVGLLCVQTFARDRPNTSVVMSMLVGDIMDLPSPKPPAFTTRQTYSDTGSSQITEESSSTNRVTITGLTAR